MIERLCSVHRYEDVVACAKVGPRIRHSYSNKLHRNLESRIGRGEHRKTVTSRRVEILRGPVVQNRLVICKTRTDNRASGYRVKIAQQLGRIVESPNQQHGRLDDILGRIVDTYRAENLGRNPPQVLTGRWIACDALVQ